MAKNEPEGIDNARYVSGVVGLRLKKLREDKGISQDMLAAEMKLMGFPWAHVTASEIERAKRRVTVDELIGLCLILGEPPASLLDPGTQPTVRIGDPSRGLKGPHLNAHTFRQFLSGELKARLRPTTSVEFELTDEKETE